MLSSLNKRILHQNVGLATFVAVSLQRASAYVKLSGGGGGKVVLRTKMSTKKMDGKELLKYANIDNIFKHKKTWTEFG